uniref:Aa_trans domain-containing protein n=1 Tax=Heterorhabditis bacteriophora TaxID=37862 RepID=A0A1I7XQ70_HETBA
MITTSLAVSLIILGSTNDFASCIPHVNYPHASYEKSSSMIIGYSCVLELLCLPMEDMVHSPQSNTTCGLRFALEDPFQWHFLDFYIQQTVNILITVHVVLALTIVFNPLNQEFEDIMKVPQEFGVQRILSRTTVMIAVVIVALTVPNFGVLLDLVGAKKHNGDLALENEKPMSIFEIIHYTPKLELTVNLLVLDPKDIIIVVTEAVILIEAEEALFIRI